ncbi:flagellar associated protein [Tribonema minus]|uniref:Nucleoside diphosphate kinase n=1 Tax=Tribonema minus TaxID=303371 RepID=A0A836CHD7_9STRA|nr:flagellar associated protein [Tribonema minus]
MMKVTSMLLLALPAMAFVAPSFMGAQVQHRAATSSIQTQWTMAMERSYIMIKPDGVQRGLVGEIISRFEKRGYKLAAMKLKQADEDLLKEHYRDLASKPFFPKLMGYMLSGPVVCMCWEGKDVVAQGRKMLGATNPLESAPGTIRGDFSLDVGRNICHGSDSVDSGKRESELWFSPAEIVDNESALKDWIYE